MSGTKVSAKTKRNRRRSAARGRPAPTDAPIGDEHNGPAARSVASPSLGELVDFARVHVRMLGVLVVLAAIGGYVAGSLVPERYSAAVTIQVADARGVLDPFGRTSAIAPPTIAEVDSIATSTATRRAAEEAAGAPTSSISDVETSSEGGTLTLSVRVAERDLAVPLADALGDVVIDQVRTNRSEEIGALVEALRDRAAAADTDLGTALEVRATELEVEAAATGAGVSILSGDTDARDVTMPRAVHLAVLLPVLVLVGALAVAYVRIAISRSDRPGAT